MITLALSKGRIYDETLPLLARCGVVPSEDPEASRKLLIGTSQPDLRIVVVRATDATGAIGVLGWESGLAVHDFHGLVDPAIARAGASAEPLGTGLPGHEKGDLLHVLAKRPTYWMWSRSLRDEPAGWPRYEPEVLRELREDYELRHIWLVDEENAEAGYFSFLERRSPRGPAAFAERRSSLPPSSRYASPSP